MPTRTPPASVAVLDGALTWTHDCLQRARCAPADAPTPCAGWDLARLLEHMEDSLAALGDAARLGHVDVPDPTHTRDTARAVDDLVRRACATRAAWLHRLTSAPMAIGDLRLGRDTVALVGALEIAVHGWDVAQAAGVRRDLPEDLATRLYDVALVAVPAADRATRFAPPVPVSAAAPAGVRLLAYLGRIQP